MEVLIQIIKNLKVIKKNSDIYRFNSTEFTLIVLVWQSALVFHFETI